MKSMKLEVEDFVDSIKSNILIMNTTCVVIMLIQKIVISMPWGLA